MKCAACGYEHREESQWVDKVLRYKSGKRKGEVKSIEKEKVTFTVGYAPFINLSFKGVEKLQKPLDQHWLGYDDVDLYACPECGTIKIEQ